MSEDKTTQVEMNNTSTVPSSTNHRDEVHMENEQHPLLNIINEIGVKIAATDFGQYGIKKIDKLLWIVENTAKWSVPQNYAVSESDKPLPPPPLLRPLPWMLFIPALIQMRIMRAVLSFVLLMLGRDAITPSTVVHFIQIRRRKLRAIKYQGIKLIRTRHNEQKQKQSFLSRLFNFPARALCSRGYVVDAKPIIFKKTAKSGAGATIDEAASKKRPHNDDDSEIESDSNLTSHDLLKKYCEIDSEDDPTYEVEEEMESDESSDEESDTEDAIVNNQNKSATEGNTKETFEEHQNGDVHELTKKGERPNTDNTELQNGEVSQPPAQTESNVDDGPTEPPTLKHNQTPEKPQHNESIENNHHANTEELPKRTSFHSSHQSFIPFNHPVKSFHPKPPRYQHNLHYQPNRDYSAQSYQNQPRNVNDSGSAGLSQESDASSTTSVNSNPEQKKVRPNGGRSYNQRRFYGQNKRSYKK